MEKGALIDQLILENIGSELMNQLKFHLNQLGNEQQRWVKSLSYTIDGKLVMALYY